MPEHDGRFHLRNGFYFQRVDDNTVEIAHGEDTLRVSVTEWASAVAATAKDSGSVEAYAHALGYLLDQPVTKLSLPPSAEQQGPGISDDVGDRIESAE